MGSEFAEAKARLRKPTAPMSTGDGTCPECGKTGLTNVGVHRSRAHGTKAG